jgi:chromatin-remodeling ATPase INO80
MSLLCTVFNFTTGEGHFDDISAKPSGAATPVSGDNVGNPSTTPVSKKRSRGPGKGTSKRAKTTKERLRLIDGDNDIPMNG